MVDVAPACPDRATLDQRPSAVPSRWGRPRRRSVRASPRAVCARRCLVVVHWATAPRRPHRLGAPRCSLRTHSPFHSATTSRSQRAALQRRATAMASAGSPPAARRHRPGTQSREQAIRPEVRRPVVPDQAEAGGVSRVTQGPPHVAGAYPVDSSGSHEQHSGCSGRSTHHLCAVSWRAPTLFYSGLLRGAQEYPIRCNATFEVTHPPPHGCLAPAVLAPLHLLHPREPAYPTSGSLRAP